MLNKLLDRFNKKKLKSDLSLTDRVFKKMYLGKIENISDVLSVDENVEYTDELMSIYQDIINENVEPNISILEPYIYSVTMLQDCYNNANTYVSAWFDVYHNLIRLAMDDHVDLVLKYIPKELQVDVLRIVMFYNKVDSKLLYDNYYKESPFYLKQAYDKQGIPKLYESCLDNLHDTYVYKARVYRQDNYYTLNLRGKELSIINLIKRYGNILTWRKDL